MTFLSEMWRFMLVRKKFWLLPILFMLVALGGLLLLGESTAIAPFIYTMF